MAAILDLQFKTLLSVKSLKELNGMQTSLGEQELSYSANQGAYESVNKDISDLITLSLEITRNETGATTQAGLAPNVAETESELDQVTTLEGLGRENNIPMEQTVVSGNARSSTPTRRPNNITRNEVSQTVMYNRKLNLIISNIPENLIGGDKTGIEDVLKNIGCGGLIQQIEKFSRLGEPRERAKRLLKLEMKSEEDVRIILSNKEKLNESPTPEVYINEDQSRAERARAYQARVMKRSTAAEALEKSGRKWGRNHSGGNFAQENEHQQRPHTNNTGGMGSGVEGGMRRTTSRGNKIAEQDHSLLAGK